MNLSLSALFVRQKLVRRQKISETNPVERVPSVALTNSPPTPPTFEDIEHHIESLSILNRYVPLHHQTRTQREIEQKYSSLHALSTAPFEAQMTAETNFLVPGDAFFA